MEVKSGMQYAVKEEPKVDNQKTEKKPCLRCQYGIFDTPVDGKLNCFAEGSSNIKLLSKEEVKEMTFCKKMVHWAKMDLSDEDTDESEIKIVNKVIGNRQ